MKKTLSTLFALLLLFTISSTTAFAQVVVDDTLSVEETLEIADSFPDVTNDYEHFAAIEYFREKGVIIGYPDGTFRPEQEANRAEALKIILLSSVIDFENDSNAPAVFPDVVEENWFFEYVNTAKQMEIVSGYDDGQFKPEQIQNIVETLKIIFLTNDIDLDSLNVEEAVFPDVMPERWYAAYALYAKEKNIIEPTYDGTLTGGRGITRGQLVELMYRTATVLENGGEPFDLSTDWAVVEYPAQGFKMKIPFGWQIVEHSDEIVFWHPDQVYSQSSYKIAYPYSASLVLHLDHNEEKLSKSEYENMLDRIYTTNFDTFQKNSLNLAEHASVEYNVSNSHDDYYIFMPENKVLQIYIAYGISDLTDHLQVQIDKMLENIEYITPLVQTGESDQATYFKSEDLLTSVRSSILEEGAGQEALASFTDLVIIETDTIGVGTGPVDYMYSESYDVTLKYERDSDTLLDMLEGNTTAF